MWLYEILGYNNRQLCFLIKQHRANGIKIICSRFHLVASLILILTKGFGRLGTLNGWYYMANDGKILTGGRGASKGIKTIFMRYLKLNMYLIFFTFFLHFFSCSLCWLSQKFTENLFSRKLKGRSNP